MIFRGCFHILLPRYCNIIIVFLKFLRTKQPLETSDGGMATKMSLNFQLHPSGKLTVSDETKTTSKEINSSHGAAPN